MDQGPRIPVAKRLDEAISLVHAVLTERIRIDREDLSLPAQALGLWLVAPRKLLDVDPMAAGSVAASPAISMTLN